MTPRMSWNQIKDLFANQWVELIDFEWDWDRTSPRWARIRHFSPDRQSLIEKIDSSGKIDDSVVLFIGAADSMIQLSANVAML